MNCEKKRSLKNSMRVKISILTEQRELVFFLSLIANRDVAAFLMQSFYTSAFMSVSGTYKETRPILVESRQ